MNNLSRSGKRIYALRTEACMKQSELAQRLSERLNGKKPVAVMTISSWENGRRAPNQSYLKALADIFQVHPNYILGLTDNRDGSPITSTKENTHTALKAIDNNQLIEISINDILIFNGKPVYITFKNYAHQAQWALVNKDRNSLILTEGVMPLSDKSVQSIDKIYVNDIYLLSVNNEAPMNIAKLLSSKHPVWCELISTDAYMKGLYNGWFHHNENHTALINERGLTLPYEGIGVSYNAFSKNRVKL